MPSTLIDTFVINIGPGNTTTIHNLDPLNLSWCKTITAELTLTTIATDAADKLDVRFQETRVPDAAYWDTRAYFSQVSGNQAASAATPYADEFTLSQDVDLTSTSRNERPTGSAGGTELLAGTVRDGPFAPPIRTVLGRIATQRVVFVISGDANNNASFVGTLRIFGHNFGTY